MYKKAIPVLLSVFLFFGASTKGPLTDFSVKSLTGETVTEDIFKDYDITMVNVWATWCGPCVRELPEIQKLYSQLPENVNIISFCLDAEGGEQASQRAKSLVKSAGMKFPVLLPGENLGSDILREVNSRGIPTTVFVDKNGNIIGDAVIGAPREVVSYYKAQIDQRLKMIK